ncbi:RHS repeat-associated core domain-containing protein [bacterium]|nr:MAG: RHS repeat-associated core domain-containing protein [bacterium]
MYMRARYYDPQAGRFTSQDPAMDGSNWFAYCDNDPVNATDPSGKDKVDNATGFGAGAAFGMLFMLLAWSNSVVGTPAGMAAATTFILMSIAAFSFALGEGKGPINIALKTQSFAMIFVTPYQKELNSFIAATIANMQLVQRLGGAEKAMGGATIAYSIVLMAAVLATYTND